MIWSNVTTYVETLSWKVVIARRRCGPNPGARILSAPGWPALRAPRVPIVF
jgi:hypothetical protein